MCGGYCKFVHLARTTPTSLCSDSLKLFDEEVRHCSASCLAVDVPDTQWHQAQLCPMLGGLGLCSLSLHSCAAFISSLAASDLGSPDIIHLQQAVSHFNAQVSPHDSLTVEAVLNTPPQQKALSLKLDTHMFQALVSFASCTSQQSSHVVSIRPPCKFLGLCHPLCRLEHAPGFRRVPSGYQMVARPRHINCFFLPLLPGAVLDPLGDQEGQVRQTYNIFIF